MSLVIEQQQVDRYMFTQRERVGGRAREEKDVGPREYEMRQNTRRQ